MKFGEKSTQANDISNVQDLEELNMDARLYTNELAKIRLTDNSSEEEPVC